jgi:quinol monooxygenase YgiN
VIIELIGIVAPPGMQEELSHTLGSFVGPMQVEPGCISAAIFQDQQDSSRLRLESRWDNISNLVNHIQADSYKKLLHVMELSETHPTIEFLTVCETRGLDLIRSAREEQSLRNTARLRHRNLRSA